MIHLCMLQRWLLFFIVLLNSFLYSSRQTLEMILLLIHILRKYGLDLISLFYTKTNIIVWWRLCFFAHVLRSIILFIVALIPFTSYSRSLLFYLIVLIISNFVFSNKAVSFARKLWVFGYWWLITALALKISVNSKLSPKTQ